MWLQWDVCAHKESWSHLSQQNMVVEMGWGLRSWMFVVEKESRWNEVVSAKWHGKNVSMHSLSGAGNDQSMREPTVDREILVQGWRADFFGIGFQAIKVQRRNFSSCDLGISNDDLANPNKKERSFQLKKKKSLLGFLYIEYDWVLRRFFDLDPSILMVEHCSYSISLWDVAYVFIGGEQSPTTGQWLLWCRYYNKTLSG